MPASNRVSLNIPITQTTPPAVALLPSDRAYAASGRLSNSIPASVGMRTSESVENGDKCKFCFQRGHHARACVQTKDIQKFRKTYGDKAYRAVLLDVPVPRLVAPAAPAKAAAKANSASATAGGSNASNRASAMMTKQSPKTASKAAPANSRKASEPDDGDDDAPRVKFFDKLRGDRAAHAKNRVKIRISDNDDPSVIAKKSDPTKVSDKAATAVKANVVAKKKVQAGAKKSKGARGRSMKGASRVDAQAHHLPDDAELSDDDSDTASVGPNRYVRARDFPDPDDPSWTVVGSKRTVRVPVNVEVPPQGRSVVDAIKLAVRKQPIRRIWIVGPKLGGYVNDRGISTVVTVADDRAAWKWHEPVSKPRYRAINNVDRGSSVKKIDIGSYKDVRAPEGPIPAGVYKGVLRTAPGHSYLSIAKRDEVMRVGDDPADSNDSAYTYRDRDFIVLDSKRNRKFFATLDLKKVIARRGPGPTYVGKRPEVRNLLRDYVAPAARLVGIELNPGPGLEVFNYVPPARTYHEAIVPHFWYFDSGPSYNDAIFSRRLYKLYVSVWSTILSFFDSDYLLNPFLRLIVGVVVGVSDFVLSVITFSYTDWFFEWWSGLASKFAVIMPNCRLAPTASAVLTTARLFQEWTIFPPDSAGYLRPGQCPAAAEFRRNNPALYKGWARLYQSRDYLSDYARLAVLASGLLVVVCAALNLRNAGLLSWVSLCYGVVSVAFCLLTGSLIPEPPNVNPFGGHPDTLGWTSSRPDFTGKLFYWLSIGLGVLYVVLGLSLAMSRTIAYYFRDNGSFDGLVRSTGATEGWFSRHMPDGLSASVRDFLSPEPVGMSRMPVSPGSTGNLSFDLKRALSPSWTSSVRSSAALWLRTLFGRRSLYVHVPIQGLARTSGEYSVLDRATHISVWHRNEHVELCSGPSVQHFATVRFLVWARHVSSYDLPRRSGFDSVVTSTMVEPGPLHFCMWGPCSPSDTPLWKAFVPTYAISTGYQPFEMTEHNGNHEFRWAGATEVVRAPSPVIYDAMSRYFLASKPGQYSVLASTLGAAQCNDALPFLMTMAGAATGAQVGSHGNSIDCSVTMVHAGAEKADRAMNLVPVFAPLCSDSLSIPGCERQALEDAIYRRVRAVATIATLSDAQAGFVHEFVNAIIPGPLVPWSTDEVYQHLSKQGQRAEFEDLQTVWSSAETNLSLFPKKEPVAPGKPARIIIAFKGPRNYEFARFTLALAEHLQLQPWWGPAKGAQDIQHAVKAMHVRARSLGWSMVEGDYAKFDATVGAPLHAIMHAVYQRAFPDDVEHIDDLLSYAMNPEAYNKHVGRVRTGFGTQSGSADTTLRNTIYCALCVYLSFREDGLSHELSMEEMRHWIFSGDDSLGAHRTPEALVSVTSSLGLTLESRVYDTGHTTLLGRLYPDPYASHICVADPRRFLPKLHLVDVPPGRTPSEALVQRALGHLVNDPMTPLLSEFSRNVLRNSQGFDTALNPLFFDWYNFSRMQRPDGVCDSVGYSDEALMALFTELLGVEPVSLGNLRTAFETTPIVPNVSLPSLTPWIVPAKRGIAVAGVPLLTAADAPDTSQPKGFVKAIATAIVESKEALEDTKPPKCLRCLSEYHVTSECVDCTLCGGMGHLARICTASEASNAASGRDAAMNDAAAMGIEIPAATGAKIKKNGRTVIYSFTEESKPDVVKKKKYKPRGRKAFVAAPTALIVAVLIFSLPVASAVRLRAASHVSFIDLVCGFISFMIPLVEGQLAIFRFQIALALIQVIAKLVFWWAYLTDPVFWWPLYRYYFPGRAQYIAPLIFGIVLGSVVANACRGVYNTVLRAIA